jgi:competence protein ComEA
VTAERIRVPIGPPAGWPGAAGAADPPGPPDASLDPGIPAGATEPPAQPIVDPLGLVDDEGERPRRRLLGGPGPFDPGRGGVKALAVVAGVVVLAAAFFAYRARPTVEPVAVRSAAPVSTAVPRPAETSPPEVVVAVSGRVHKPGLVRLPAGARVADAVEAAGGARPGTDLSSINLARRVVDGELILVGVAPPPGAAPPAAGSSAGPAGKVDLNTATLEQLDALPGVGPVLAQRIIDHRERNGGFHSVGELRTVDGIGAARYEELKDLVTA